MAKKRNKKRAPKRRPAPKRKPAPKKRLTIRKPKRKAPPKRKSAAKRRPAPKRKAAPKKKLTIRKPKRNLKIRKNTNNNNKNNKNKKNKKNNKNNKNKNRKLRISNSNNNNNNRNNNNNNNRSNRNNNNNKNNKNKNNKNNKTEIEVDSALEYESKSSSDNFQFKDVLADIKTNASNLYEQRSDRDKPGKIGSYNVDNLSDVKEKAKEVGGNLDKLYKGSKFLGGKIGKNRTLRINTQGKLQQVNLNQDPYGSEAMSTLSTNLSKMPGESRSEFASLNRILNGTKRGNKGPLRQSNKILESIQKSKTAVNETKIGRPKSKPKSNKPKSRKNVFGIQSTKSNSVFGGRTTKTGKGVSIEPKSKFGIEPTNSNSVFGGRTTKTAKNVSTKRRNKNGKKR